MGNRFNYIVYFSPLQFLIVFVIDLAFRIAAFIIKYAFKITWYVLKMLYKLMPHLYAALKTFVHYADKALILTEDYIWRGSVFVYKHAPYVFKKIDTWYRKMWIE